MFQSNHLSMLPNPCCMFLLFPLTVQFLLAAQLCSITFCLKLLSTLMPLVSTAVEVLSYRVCLTVQHLKRACFVKMRARPMRDHAVEIHSLYTNKIYNFVVKNAACSIDRTIIISFNRFKGVDISFQM